jgi:hypothetical protein
MDSQVLSAGVLFGLSALVGSYGIITLGFAYGEGELTRWGRLAALGGLCVLFSATLSDVASHMIR